MKMVSGWWCEHPGACGDGVGGVVSPCVLCAFPVGVVVLVVVCVVGVGCVVRPGILCVSPGVGIVVVAGWGALGG